MTILVPVSGAQKDDHLIVEGKELADAFGDTLTVLHVVPEEDFEAYRKEMEELGGKGHSITQEETSAARVAERAVQRALPTTASVETAGRVGEPAEEIVTAGGDLDARYIVVGGRRRSPVGKAIFGSTTQSVLLESDRPVVTFIEE